MPRQYTKEEWAKLPEETRVAVWEAYHAQQAAAEAQQKVQQWEAWAQPNKQYLERWGEVRQRLQEIEKADEERDWTYEEMQSEIKRNRAEARQANQHIQGLAAELGSSRQRLEQLAGIQRQSVELSADMSVYARETGRDPRKVLEFAREKGISTWTDAVNQYSEQAKESSPRTSHSAWARPGRQARVSREVDVNNSIVDILNRGGEGESDTPMVGGWTRASRRRANPVPGVEE